jgi:DNA-binding HxlR family transcriptional regulator
MTSYGEFCLAARTLEIVGDRWSRLIVRDLLPGRRRFGELHRLLTGVTPKWLTIRLRQLEAAGIVTREQEPGRREVWYALTDKGRDLAPVVGALMAWGARHGRHALAPEETAHAEHQMPGLAFALDAMEVRLSGPQVWRFDLDPGGSYALAFDGQGWEVGGAGDDADVVVETTPRDLAELVTRTPDDAPAPPPAMEVRGDPRPVAEFRRTFGIRGAT